MEQARHASEYERASAASDAVESNPSAKGYDVAWRAFQDAKLPADHTKARAELDRDTKAANAAYHDEVARIGQEHGVTVRYGLNGDGRILGLNHARPETLR